MPGQKLSELLSLIVEDLPWLSVQRGLKMRWSFLIINLLHIGDPTLVNATLLKETLIEIYQKTVQGKKHVVWNS